MPTLHAEPYVWPEALLEGDAAQRESQSWLALHTRPRAEKALARRLLKNSVSFFLPLYARPSTAMASSGSQVLDCTFAGRRCNRSHHNGNSGGAGELLPMARLGRPSPREKPRWPRPDSSAALSVRRLKGPRRRPEAAFLRPNGTCQKASSEESVGGFRSGIRTSVYE